MAVRTFLDVSTAHITSADDDLLRRHLPAVRSNGSARPELSILSVDGHAYGYWVASLLAPTGDLNEVDLIAAGFSEAFVALMRHARNINVDWIKLDADGDDVEGLESFEW